MVDIDKLSALTESGKDKDNDSGGIDIMQAITGITNLIGKAKELHDLAKPQQQAQQISHVAVAPAPAIKRTEPVPEATKMQSAPIQQPAQESAPEVQQISDTQKINGYYEKVLTFLPLIKMAWGDLTLTQLEEKLRNPQQKAEIMLFISNLKF